MTSATDTPGKDGAQAHRRWLVIAGVHVGALLLWHALVTAFQVPAFVLPAPAAVLATLAKANYAWGSNTLVTATEITGGY
ncbi:MAG TPA: hypothetical protein VD860_11225, partial [Azospirillum sp.]|nr:hypothetical protein [Azospirillum sp.]